MVGEGSCLCGDSAEGRGGGREGSVSEKSGECGGIARAVVGGGCLGEERGERRRGGGEERGAAPCARREKRQMLKYHERWLNSIERRAQVCYNLTILIKENVLWLILRSS